MVKKNILILQNQIPYYRKALYNGLSKYYNITVLHSGPISISDNDLYKEIVIKNTKISKLNFQFGMLKQIKINSYDAIIAMFDISWVYNILALFLKPEKTKFLWWGHGYGNNRQGNMLRNLLVKQSDGLILYSNRFVDEFKKNGIDPNKIYIGDNTIEVENYCFNKNIKRDTFLFVGRIQERKGLEFLFQAFSEIIDKIPNYIKIVIVGDGDKEKEKLKLLAKKINIENRIVFKEGTIDPDLLKNYFQKALAYVSPGHVGLGVLHSFAYGVPVVTCKNRRHAPEFDNLNSSNSFICEDYSSLKSNLSKLANNRNLSYKKGKEAYLFYKNNRTMELMVEKFKKAIENICS